MMIWNLETLIILTLHRTLSKVGGECRDLNTGNVWYAATCSLVILHMLNMQAKIFKLIFHKRWIGFFL